MAEPSKVIHIRNVGHEISESDLLQVVQPFGTVAKLVMLRAKNQALIQMEDLASAVSVLQYYTTIQPSVRGRNVYLQFSSHQELTTDQSSHGRNPDQFRQVIEKDFVNENLWPELIPQVEASNPEQQYA